MPTVGRLAAEQTAQSLIGNRWRTRPSAGSRNHSPGPQRGGVALPPLRRKAPRGSRPHTSWRSHQGEAWVAGQNGAVLACCPCSGRRQWRRGCCRHYGSRTDPAVPLNAVWLNGQARRHKSGRNFPVLPSRRRAKCHKNSSPRNQDWQGCRSQGFRCHTQWRRRVLRALRAADSCHETASGIHRRALGSRKRLDNQQALGNQTALRRRTVCSRTVHRRTVHKQTVHSPKVAAHRKAPSSTRRTRLPRVPSGRCQENCRTAGRAMWQRRTPPPGRHPRGRCRHGPRSARIVRCQASPSWLSAARAARDSGRCARPAFCWLLVHEAAGQRLTGLSWMRAACQQTSRPSNPRRTPVPSLWCSSPSQRHRREAVVVAPAF